MAGSRIKRYREEIRRSNLIRFDRITSAKSLVMTENRTGVVYEQSAMIHSFHQLRRLLRFARNDGKELRYWREAELNVIVRRYDEAI